MKKVILMMIGILLIVGCTIMKAETPTEKTKIFLDKYKNLDEDVMSDLIDSVDNENLNEENREAYKGILERQYKDLKYDIVDEKIEDAEATVSVDIIVYDLNKISSDADEYLVGNEGEFLTNGTYDNDKFMKYKLDKMKSTEQTIDYNIKIYLTKVDEEWVVQEPNSATKEKIHGLYNSED
jgi:hypothetical protein